MPNSAIYRGLVQIIRLTDTSLTANGYYPGVIEVWDSVNRQMIDSYPIWVKDVNL